MQNLTRSVSLGTLVLALLANSAGAQPQPTFRSIALSGDPAPGMPAGVKFASFASPTARIDNAGNVAFENQAGGSGSWLHTSSGTALRYRYNQDAPWLGDGCKVTSSYIGFSGVSSIVFYGGVYSSNPSSLRGTGLLSTRTGFLQPMALEGKTPIPDTSLVVGEMNWSLLPAVNSLGQSAFLAEVGPQVYGGAGPLTVLTDRSGSLTMVAPPGSPVPGIEGATFQWAGTDPVMNDLGRTAFISHISTGSGPGQALCAEDANGTRLVARTNTPGSSGLVVGQFNGPPSINNAGQVAFRTRGTFDPSSSEIWSEGAGTLELVARNTQHAPGTPEGTTFSQIGYGSVLIGGSGHTVFTATLTGTEVTTANSAGLWCASTDGLKLVSRSGDIAPDMPDGVTIGGPSKYSVNALGQVVFTATFQGPGVASGSIGIWYTDPDAGALHRLIARGDSFQVAPGDIRTVNGLWIGSGSGGQDGRSSCLNDRGELVFSASFIDGSSGIFVAQLPEPGTLLLIAMGAIVPTMKRRRRE